MVTRTYPGAIVRVRVSAQDIQAIADTLTLCGANPQDFTFSEAVSQVLKLNCERLRSSGQIPSEEIHSSDWISRLEQFKPPRSTGLAAQPIRTREQVLLTRLYRGTITREEADELSNLQATAS